MHAGGYLSRIVAPISLVLQVAAGDTWGGSLNPSLSQRVASPVNFISQYLFSTRHLTQLIIATEAKASRARPQSIAKSQPKLCGRPWEWTIFNYDFEYRINNKMPSIAETPCCRVR